MTTHEFDASMQAGKAGEAALDRHFAQWWDIKPVTLHEERTRGIDRRFIRNGGPLLGAVMTVEYKTDYQTSRTGNVFLETMSVDRTGAPGWLLKSEAQVLVYLMVGESATEGGSDFFFIDMGTLKHDAMTKWADFPSAQASNSDYQTHGLIIPLRMFNNAYGRFRRTIYALEVET